MASKETWKLVKKYFRPDSKIDKWGDPDVIDDTHLLRLFDLRVYLGVPVYVTAGAKNKGHRKKSYHYPRKIDGKIVSFATDIVIPEYPLSPFDLVLDATRFFTGVGYYTFWEFGNKTVGGLHTDSRPFGIDNDGTLNYKDSRWMGILGEDGRTKYLALTFENMLKYSNKRHEIDHNDLH